MRSFGRMGPAWVYRNQRECRQLCAGIGPIHVGPSTWSSRLSHRTRSRYWSGLSKQRGSDSPRNPGGAAIKGSVWAKAASDAWVKSRAVRAAAWVLD
jgi:hypothetical protein